MKKMLSNPVIPDYRPRSERTVEEHKLSFEPCCLCGKKISQGPYGRWGTGGTCSKACEDVMQSRPRDWGEPKGGVTCTVQDAEESLTIDRQK